MEQSYKFNIIIELSLDDELIKEFGSTKEQIEESFKEALKDVKSNIYHLDVDLGNIRLENIDIG